MDSLWIDLRYAARTLAKAPGFAVIAIVTLALGIGANTAIFTVANSLLLRPLPYSDPNRLVMLYSSKPDQRADIDGISYPAFELIRDHNRSFASIAAFADESFNFSGQGEPENIPAVRVSYNFFDVLGVQPTLGRTFLLSEDKTGGARAALISYRMWTTRFAGSRDVIGQNIVLNSEDYTIIGVLPPNFSFPLSLTKHCDIFVPRVFELSLETPERVRAGSLFLHAIARLSPGVTIPQAHADLEVLNRQYQHEFPTNADAASNTILQIGNLQEKAVANIRPQLLILTFAVGFVLLIACANVAGLMLARALARKREIVVRTALGAPRSAIIRQLLTETVLLATIAGVIGIFLGLAGVRVLAALGSASIPQLADVSLDWKILLFTAAISILSGLLFGLLPALQISKPDLNAALRDQSRSSTASRQRHVTREILIISQVALSTVLLIGAGLLINSFLRLANTSVGVDPVNVLTMAIELPPAHYSSPDQMIAFYRRLRDAANAIPGVQAAGISSALPINPARITPILVEDQPVVPLAQRPFLLLQTISPEYAKAMHVPLLRGRDFTDQDDVQSPKVAIANQAFVRRFWPNENPLGKKLWIGRMTEPAEIVGVLGDEKNMSLAEDPQPEVLLPFPQLPWPNLNLSVRSNLDARSVVAAVRQQLASIDPSQPITSIQTLQEVIDTGKAQPRFIMFLIGVFSAIAFLLAIIGIYGVISYSVAQRTPEFGIRMVFGATHRDILNLVLSRGLGLAASGIGIGLIASLGLTRTIASQLYQVSPNDPFTLAASAILFLFVAVAASYLPARRATHANPMDALHYE